VFLRLGFLAVDHPSCAAFGKGVEHALGLRWIGDIEGDRDTFDCLVAAWRGIGGHQDIIANDKACEIFLPVCTENPIRI
jgi:hypothetical protein